MNKTLFTAMMLAVFILPLSLSAAMQSDVRKGLITAKALEQELQNSTSSQLVIEVGWGGPEDYYNKGHIPGSFHVNTDEIEYDTFKARSTTKPEELGRSTTVEEDLAKGLSSDDTLPANWWNIYPDQFLLPALANMGITIDSSVVIYAKDPTAAARLAWTLMYAGVDDVRLLDGGLESWKKAGFPVSTETTARKPVKSFGTNKPLHPEYLVDIPFVRTAIHTHSDEFILADIRTKKEYDGISAPYSYIPSKGRVKDARWGEAGDGPWTMENYVNADGTFKSTAEVEIMWAENGITADKHVAFYCGTGWRSSLAFYFAHMMGWENISNFDSSWYEWSLGPDAKKNPVQ